MPDGTGAHGEEVGEGLGAGVSVFVAVGVGGMESGIGVGNATVAGLTVGIDWHAARSPRSKNPNP